MEVTNTTTKKDNAIHEQFAQPQQLTQLQANVPIQQQQTQPQLEQQQVEQQPINPPIAQGQEYINNQPANDQFPINNNGGIPNNNNVLQQNIEQPLNGQMQGDQTQNGQFEINNGSN